MATRGHEGASKSGGYAGPSFMGALKDLARAAFTENMQGASQAEVFQLMKELQFVEAMKLLESCPTYWEARDEGGRSLLHWAALGGGLQLVRVGIVKDLTVDARASNLQTPLMWAAAAGHVQVASLLLQAEADPMAQDAKGASVLTIAVQNRQHTLMQILIERCMSAQSLLQTPDVNGCAPVHWAAYSGDIVGLKLLEGFSADLEATDSQGMTPLHRAVCAGEVGVVDFLIDQAADPALRDAAGRDCMDLAAELQDDGMAATLLGAVCRLWANRRQRSLRRGCSKGNLESSSPMGRSPSDMGRSLSLGGDLQSSVQSSPVVLGAAIWADAAQSGGSLSSTAPGDPDASSSARNDASERLQTPAGCSFSIDFVASWDEVLLTAIRKIRQSDMLSTPMSAACVATSTSQGRAIDWMRPFSTAPCSEQFPVQVKALAMPFVAFDEKGRWCESCDAAVAWKMQAQPERFGCTLLTAVPPQHRWSLWQAKLGLTPAGEAAVDASSDYLDKACAESEWAHLIDQDVRRTFKEFGAAKQDQLRRILNAYAVHSPQVGYCQGMNLLVGVLLLVSNGNEDGCFRALIALMEDHGMAGFYCEGLPLLQKYLHASNQLLAEAVPELLEHLVQEQVDYGMVIQQCILTTFVDTLPLATVVMVWDLLILEGPTALLRVIVSFWSGLSEVLNGLRGDCITKCLKSLARSDHSAESELLAARLGHVLTKHASSVRIPEHIFTSLRDGP
mmetsp:Transcript_24111/g.56118  ORF Transcript_24111/g.56118 Transcript_24111/m.56118 type:complete len:733 (+) Transcript_24111:25-2223(+)